MKNWKYIDGAEGIKIGNKKVENTEVVKDGDVWVVLYAEGTKSKEFDSEQEAKKFAAQIGNGFSEKEKILLEIKGLKEERAGWIKYKEEHPEDKTIDQKIKSYTKDISDLQEKMLKVGNKKAISSWFHMNKYGIEVGDWSWDWKNGAPEPSKQQEIERKIKSYVSQINKDVPNGESDERDEIFGRLDRFVRSQGLNKKTGNDTPAEYAKRPPKIVGGNSLPEELEKDVEKKDKEKVGEIEKLEKLGNSDTISEYNAEIQRLTRKAEQLRRMGQGKSAMDIERQIEKLGKELREYTENKVGNATSEYEILKQDPSKMHPLYKKAYEEAMKKLAREDEEFKKRFEREYGVKAKNESSDDKFAYVMREFEEGKLKTPDGKVVTDPAQAKAIAYSESKKTENGLARARNAIKK